MKKLLALAILLSLGMGAPLWAMDCPSVQSATTVYQCTQTVFNDNGATIISGYTVSWDDDDTDFSTLGYPYVITTTTADDPYTAGVMLRDCPDQSLCEIVVRGSADVVVDDASDDATVDTLVGIHTANAGRLGDYATGANTCALGMLKEFIGGEGVDNTRARVWVDIDCD